MPTFLFGMAAVNPALHPASVLIMSRASRRKETSFNLLRSKPLLPQLGELIEKVTRMDGRPPTDLLLTPADYIVVHIEMRKMDPPMIKSVDDPITEIKGVPIYMGHG